MFVGGCDRREGLLLLPRSIRHPMRALAFSHESIGLTPLRSMSSRRPDDRPDHGGAQAGARRWNALCQIEDTRFGGVANRAE